MHNQIHKYRQIQHTGKYNIQADSVVQGRTVLLTSWFRSIVAPGERYNSYYANNPWRAAHIMVIKISIHLGWVGPEKFNRRSNGRKLNFLPQWQTTELFGSMVQFQLSTAFFSKSSNSQNQLFRAWCHPLSSHMSCPGVYYDNGDCYIICVRV